ncbi:YbaY family lipoprotein [Defluviimonas sp. D31]|nr:YbaY family lipoprotein [Defluviimonas sp. D31]
MTVLAFAGLGVNAMEAIKGTATYRERIAMPPGVTFEVRLEDVSLMDVPSKILSTVTLNEAGNPPYEFTIPYNPEVIQDARRYTVRASLRLGERLLFTTDTHTPVLTGGAGNEVAITMVQVQTVSEPPHRMIGEFVYFADAATFAECGTKEVYPVTIEGAYLDAERGYLNAQSEPMAPVAVVLEGEIAKREGTEGGKRDMLVINRLAGFVPGLTCERAMADSDVENTYWRILSIAGDVLENTEIEREPHIILRPSEGAFTSTVGCNTINGSYTLAGSALSLGAGPMTMMACPPPLDEIERAWTQGISSVSKAIVTGPTMELVTAEGMTVAFLEAVALP